MVDCNDIYQLMAEVKIISNGFERRFIKEREGSLTYGSIGLQKDGIKVVQSNIQLASISKTSLFPPDCNNAGLS